MERRLSSAKPRAPLNNTGTATITESNHPLRNSQLAPALFFALSPYLKLSFFPGFYQLQNIQILGMLRMHEDVVLNIIDGNSRSSRGLGPASCEKAFIVNSGFQPCESSPIIQILSPNYKCKRSRNPLLRARSLHREQRLKINSTSSSVTSVLN